MDKLGHIANHNQNMKELVFDLKEYFDIDLLGEDCSVYQNLIDNIMKIEYLTTALRQELRKNHVRLKDIEITEIIKEQNLHKVLKFPKTSSTD